VAGGNGKSGGGEGRGGRGERGREERVRGNMGIGEEGEEGHTSFANNRRTESAQGIFFHNLPHLSHVAGPAYPINAGVMPRKTQ